MGTVVAIESGDGVVLAADKRDVQGGTVRGDQANRLFAFDVAVAGAVGDQGDIDEFGRRLEQEIQRYELERDTDVGIDQLARIAADVAEETGVDGVVGGQDGDGRARLREIGADGRALPNETVALGSGAQTALGRLEDTKTASDLNAVAEEVRSVLRTVGERDLETGRDIDVEILPSN